MSQKPTQASKATPPIADISSQDLSARLEPFDSYWQAPDNVESGYKRFGAYYRANYLPRLPKDRNSRILIVSCGPGYLVEVLKHEGYDNLVAIDSDPVKIAFARQRGLPCIEARGFEYLKETTEEFDVIIPEQELNHLTIDETIIFLKLARSRLKPNGKIIAYGMNGANPLVGSENLAHNIDHFYTLTEYSFTQILEMTGFKNPKVFPLKLYVFWRNPMNYVGLAATSILETILRVVFILYGKKVTVLSKKLLAEAEAAER
jgi:2-polyprenyl-3-methyl-5-hydroxy-6-metoxy-1,4-benzoquinol methylase